MSDEAKSKAWIGLLEDAGYEPEPHRLLHRTCVSVAVDWSRVMHLGANLAAQAAVTALDNGGDADAVCEAVTATADTMRACRQGVDWHGADIIYWPLLRWPEEGKAVS